MPLTFSPTDLDAIMQFGYVSLFVVAFPLVGGARSVSSASLSHARFSLLPATPGAGATALHILRAAQVERREPSARHAAPYARERPKFVKKMQWAITPHERARAFTLGYPARRSSLQILAHGF